MKSETDSRLAWYESSSYLVTLWLDLQAHIHLWLFFCFDVTGQ